MGLLNMLYHRPRPNSLEMFLCVIWILWYCISETGKPVFTLLVMICRRHRSAESRPPFCPPSLRASTVGIPSAWPLDKDQSRAAFLTTPYYTPALDPLSLEYPQGIFVCCEVCPAQHYTLSWWINMPSLYQCFSRVLWVPLLLLRPTACESPGSSQIRAASYCTWLSSHSGPAATSPQIKLPWRVQNKEHLGGESLGS